MGSGAVHSPANNLLSRVKEETTQGLIVRWLLEGLAAGVGSKGSQFLLLLTGVVQVDRGILSKVI